MNILPNKMAQNLGLGVIAEEFIQLLLKQPPETWRHPIKNYLYFFFIDITAKNLQSDILCRFF